MVAGCATADADTITIAAFGDSLTQGYGLPAQQGFVPQLEEWLRANGADVTVVNAGVSGDTTAGGLSRVDWAITPETDAMILELGANDFLRGIDPAVSRENLDGILSVADEAGLETLLVAIPASTNYGTEFKTQFDGMYVDLAEKYDVPLYPNFMEPLGEGETVAGAAEQYLQSDGLHPTAEGVALIVEGIGPSVLELIEGLE
ncbi:arylesterase [Pelagovum pacificum]|nr:arylesterase [Pelagovum pacificum]